MPSEEAKRETHASYGLLQIGRVTGSSGPLFGSSMEHSQFIVLRVKRAVLHRDLHRNWYFDLDGHANVVEIAMSAAQFAEAITSMNYGSGTPCTIRRVNGESMPEPPFKSVREEFCGEFQQKMSRLADDLATRAGGIKQLLTKKSLNKADREYIVGALDRLVLDVGSNIPFVHKSFDEAVEDTVTVAKAEVEAFMTSAVMEAGHKVLREQLPGEPPRLLGLEEV